MGHVGIIENVDVSRQMFRVLVYTSDDQDDIEYVYFDTRAAAERFISALPEATR